MQRSRRGHRPAPPRVLNEQRRAAREKADRNQSRLGCVCVCGGGTKGIHLSVHPSLRLCLFIHASTRPSILHPSCRSINTSIRLSVNSSVNHPSFHPASLCVHPPSIRLSILHPQSIHPSAKQDRCFRRLVSLYISDSIYVSYADFFVADFSLYSAPCD